MDIVNPNIIGVLRPRDGFQCGDYQAKFNVFDVHIITRIIIRAVGKRDLIDADAVLSRTVLRITDSDPKYGYSTFYCLYNI